MKLVWKLRIGLLIVPLAISFATLIGAGISAYTTFLPSAPLPTADQWKQAKEGDVVFRVGSSVLSIMIAIAENGGWTQVGILRRTRDGSLEVIHANLHDIGDVGKGAKNTVRAEPLDSFVADSRSVGLFRIQNNAPAASTAAAIAGARIGHPMKDGARFVQEVFAAANMPLSISPRASTTSNGVAAVMPSDIAASKSLQRIF